MHKKGAAGVGGGWSDHCSINALRSGLLRFHGLSTLDRREFFDARPLIARLDMRVSRGRARVPPIAGGDEPLHVGSTVAPQPRRPGVAEGMEAHKPQPVRRDAAFFLRLVSSSVLGSERHRRSILPERRREPRHSPAANSALYEV